jgi:predicted component of type VI protein secretion system
MADGQLRSVLELIKENLSKLLDTVNFRQYLTPRKDAGNVEGAVRSQKRFM